MTKKEKTKKLEEVNRPEEIYRVRLQEYVEKRKLLQKYESEYKKLATDLVSLEGVLAGMREIGGFDSSKVELEVQTAQNIKKEIKK